jgi:hypothetical protein
MVYQEDHSGTLQRRSVPYVRAWLVRTETAGELAVPGGVPQRVARDLRERRRLV